MKAAHVHPHEKPHHPNRLLSGLLFGFVLTLALGGVHGSSAWIHLRTGQKFLSEGVLPRVDPFSYGSARARWETDSWLTDVLFAKADDVGGPPLVRGLTAAAIAGGFALMLPISQGNPMAAAGLLALAASAAWAGFAEGPASFDFLFFALFVRLLRPRQRLRWSDGAAAAGLTALWTNVHGASAPLALMMVSLKVFKASLRTATHEGLGYWAMLCACAFAFSLNPHGYDVLRHVFADAVPRAEAWPTSLLSLSGALILAGFAGCWLTLQQEFVTTISAAGLPHVRVTVPVKTLPGVAAAKTSELNVIGISVP